MLMLVSMSLTVHFIEASQYWAEAGRAGQARKVVTANQNTISELCHCTPQSSQLSTRTGKFWQHCSLLALVLLAVSVLTSVKHF